MLSHGSIGSLKFQRNKRLVQQERPGLFAVLQGRERGTVLELPGSTDVMHPTDETTQHFQAIEIIDCRGSAPSAGEEGDDKVLVSEPGLSCDF